VTEVGGPGHVGRETGHMYSGFSPSIGRHDQPRSALPTTPQTPPARCHFRTTPSVFATTSRKISGSARLGLPRWR
jgi:hypothetical protein